MCYIRFIHSRVARTTICLYVCSAVICYTSSQYGHSVYAHFLYNCQQVTWSTKTRSVWKHMCSYFHFRNNKQTVRFLLPDINQSVMVKNLDATHLGFSPFQTGLYQVTKTSLFVGTEMWVWYYYSKMIYSKMMARILVLWLVNRVL